MGTGKHSSRQQGRARRSFEHAWDQRYSLAVNLVAIVLNGLIASPGDTSELRDVVGLALHEWNGDRALASGETGTELGRQAESR